MSLRKLFKTISKQILHKNNIPDDKQQVAYAKELKLEEFQDTIQYVFQDSSLLIQALTHRSCLNNEVKNGLGLKKGFQSNERLEFLGDAVLNYLVTDHIYRRYVTYSEGQLSKIKSLLVSRKIIGEVAKSINLGAYLIMGQSEKKTGGQHRVSIISNAFEALLGAVYLDSDIVHAEKLLEMHLFHNIEEIINNKKNVNYKSKILEMAQRDGFGTPHYPIIEEKGPDHAKLFTIGIDIAGVRLGEGKGANKKDAQQNAAYNATFVYNKDYIFSRIKGDSEK